MTAVAIRYSVTPVLRIPLDVPPTLLARTDGVVELADMDARLDLGRTACRPRRILCRWRATAEAPLFIAMRATDLLQHLLYFVRDPWPWVSPMATGIHLTSRLQPLIVVNTLNCLLCRPLSSDRTPIA